MEIDQYHAVVSLELGSLSSSIHIVYDETNSKVIMERIRTNKVTRKDLENFCGLHLLPETLHLCATHPLTSSRSLMEIIAGNKNVECFEAVAKHKNCRRQHLEIILESGHTPYWFETDCGIAQSRAVTSAIIEMLLQKYAITPLHENRRLPKIKYWQKERIATLLHTNRYVNERYHEHCLAIMNPEQMFHRIA